MSEDTFTPIGDSSTDFLDKNTGFVYHKISKCGHHIYLKCAFDDCAAKAAFDGSKNTLNVTGQHIVHSTKELTNKVKLVEYENFVKKLARETPLKPNQIRKMAQQQFKDIVADIGLSNRTLEWVRYIRKTNKKVANNNVVISDEVKLGEPFVDEVVVSDEVKLSEPFVGEVVVPDVVKLGEPFVGDDGATYIIVDQNEQPSSTEYIYVEVKDDLNEVPQQSASQNNEDQYQQQNESVNEFNQNEQPISANQFQFGPNEQSSEENSENVEGVQQKSGLVELVQLVENTKENNFKPKHKKNKSKHVKQQKKSKNEPPKKKFKPE